MPLSPPETGMKIGVIVQARMSSRRFPGKVLYVVHDKPLLLYLLERLDRSRAASGVVVATSAEPSDDRVFDFCRRRATECHRGPLKDVALRFLEVLESYRFDAFVRVNGDSPLLDQRLIDTAVDIFLSQDCDIVTNVMPRTFPKGQSVEVVRSDVFKKGYDLMRGDDEREHVTMFFYRNRDAFKIHNFESQSDCGEVTLSVDTREDMDIFSSIIGRMKRPHWEYGYEDVLGLYHEVTALSGRKKA